MMRPADDTVFMSFLLGLWAGLFAASVLVSMTATPEIPGAACPPAAVREPSAFDLSYTDVDGKMLP